MDAMPERIDGVFVQSAGEFTSEGDEISLHAVVVSTVYFADRPRREVGHLPTREFIDMWRETDGRFFVDPPKAVLSFLELDDAPDDVSVVLRAPRLEDGTLTYVVDALAGVLPASGGACSLFIDVFRRPLMPASVGSRRRVNGRAGRE
jgi:hypothetical protein